jgi:hypothetical protein
MTRSLYRTWVVLALVALLNLVWPTSAGTTVAPPRSNSVYGMDILGVGWQWSFPRVEAWPRLTGPIRLDLLDSALRQAAEAGVRWNRLTVQWCMVELEQDQWFWDDVDAAIQIGRNYGIETVPVLMFTPYWAVAGAPYMPECTYNVFKNYPPTDMADWEDFVRTMVRRYGLPGQDSIHYWEIWNEPDLWEFLVTNPPGGDTKPIYAELLNRAARIIRAESPAAQVLTGGFSDINGPSYLDDLLAMRGTHDVRQSFDIVSFHAYSQHTRRIDNIRAALAKHGLSHRPLWDTELNNWGWSYEAAQAGLADLYRTVLSNGVSRTFWYMSWTSGWGPGIFNPRNPEWEPTPFVPSPFYQTFKSQAAPFRLPTQPVPIDPDTVVYKPRQIFVWQAAAAGDYPIVGYKLQLDNTTFMAAPRFARPEMDVWVSLELPNYLPLVTGGRGGSELTTAAPARTAWGLPDDPKRIVSAAGHHNARTSSILIYILEAPLAWGMHYWRVAAVDARGNVGPYSEPRPLWVRMPFASYVPLVE